MEEYVLQLVMAAIGAVAYGLVFHMERRYLPSAAVGGLLCWLVYLGSQRYFTGAFLPSLAASLVVALYAEILARVCKAPSTPFFAVSEMPLIPGGSLYYCMMNALAGDSQQAAIYGMRTFATAVGIAGGMSIVWALCDLSRKLAQKRGRR